MENDLPRMYAVVPDYRGAECTGVRDGDGGTVVSDCRFGDGGTVGGLHDRFGAVRRIVDRSPSAGRQIDLEMLPGLVNAGVHLADAGRIVVSRCVVDGEHLLDVLQETVVVLRLGQAPLEFAQRVETRKKHVLERGFVLDIFRPEVRLDADDMPPLFFVQTFGNGLVAVHLVDRK